MGREIKRVALDFNHPLGEAWLGYLNPHYEQCPHCVSGSSKARRIFEETIMELMFTPRRLHGSDPETSQKLSELTVALAGRDIGLLGHDSIDRWRAQDKIIKAAGLDEKWGWCEYCDGDDIHPDIKEAYEAWQPTDPPPGEGWQVWENVTEGSPISPVFATQEELVGWLIEQGYTREASESFVKTEYSFSLAIIPGEGVKKTIEMNEFLE